MGHYRIYLLDSAGRIVSGRDLMCDGDGAARSDVAGSLKAGQLAEVWSGSRRVGRVGRNGGGNGPAYAGVPAVVANDTSAAPRHVR